MTVENSPAVTRNPPCDWQQIGRPTELGILFTESAVDPRIHWASKQTRPWFMAAIGCALTKTTQTGKSPRVLVIDVGGTNTKLRTKGRKEPLKIPSGPTMTASKMVRLVKEAIRDWKFDRVAIGLPAPIINGHPLREPHNLGGGWVGFNFRKGFGCPVKIINDAAMQAVGSYQGGRMLFLGLGTGLGSAMIVDGVVEAMELAHMTYKKGKTFEAYAGERGGRRLGAKKWGHTVGDIVDMLSTAMEADYVILGGGNARKLKKVPHGAQLGNNDFAFVGGFRMWRTVHKARLTSAASDSGR